MLSLTVRVRFTAGPPPPGDFIRECHLSYKRAFKKMRDSAVHLS